MIKKIIAVVLLAACSGDDYTVVYVSDYTQEQDILTEGGRRLPVVDPVDDPEFAGFSDEDELDRYCQEKPDYVECGELGLSEQAFTSHQYHGQGSEALPCYSAAGRGVVGGCDFPNTKQIKVVSALYDAVNGIGDFAYEQEDIVGRDKFDWVYESLTEAFQSFHGKSGITVSSTGTQTLYVAAAAPTGSAVGSGGLISGFQNRIMNAPVAPNGEDEGLVRSAHSGVVYLNPRNMVIFLDSSCAGGSGETQLRNYAYNVAIHEFLHSMGFAHFYTGIMAPVLGCNYTTFRISVASGFMNALSVYGSTTPGINILADNGLLAQRPNGP
jgi:hypothetical protein